MLLFSIVAEECFFKRNLR